MPVLVKVCLPEQARMMRIAASGYDRYAQELNKSGEHVLAGWVRNQSRTMRKMGEELIARAGQIDRMLDTLDDEREVDRCLHESGWRSYDDPAINYRSDWYDYCETEECFSYGLDGYEVNNY